jgi:alkyl hydroperoxide reductase subunit AhpC
MADRHDEFLAAGGRVFGLSADSPGQNAGVMETLALQFPVLSDESKDNAIRPLGFDDEADPRQISRPGVVVINPDGEVAYRFVGRDYADRPDEDDVLRALTELGLPATTQDHAETGPVEPGEKAMPGEGLKFYFSGAKFATLALRRRHRELGPEFKDDTKAYIAMVERYIDALRSVRGRRA